MDSLLHLKLTEAQWISFITLLVIGLPVAAYILRTCLSLFNEEMPSYRKAMFIVPVVALGSYLAFDVLSYLVLLAIRDSKTIQRTAFGQPGFGFSQWLFTALPIKWAVISFIPLIRYTLVFIVIAIAGILQVFFLTIPFRKALFIFAAQWTANLFAYFIISNVLHFCAGLIGHSSGLHIDINAKYEAAISNDKAKEALNEANEAVKTGLHSVHERADPMLNELKENLKPITDRLPAPVNRFLDSGGWWLVIGLLSVIFMLWARSLWKKIKRAFRKGKLNKKKLLLSSEKWASGELFEDLSIMTPPISRPGKNRVTVKGIPSRIYLIIMAKAGGAGPDLSEEQSEAILDYVLPGLGEVTSRDYPRVRVWEPQYSPEGFTQMFNQNIRVPEPKGTKSNWIIANGTVKMGRDKIYLGIAFFADEPNLVRNIAINNDQWLDVLRIETLNQ
ncbi:MAG: hypothetical protein EBQ87_16370 [Planctomycetes bacterium]|nr:hypothetical protein [Planctomycetota bacterium]